MPTVLVTGANRGLGLEFVRQYLAGAGASCLLPQPPEAAELQALTGQSLRVLALDVSDHGRVAALAAELTEPIDLLLNNAGTYGPSKMDVGRIDYARWAEVLAVNTLAPMRLVECFLDHVARSQRRTIACLSSLMGSIGANSAGRHYLYRFEQGGRLNAVVKSLAVDLRDRAVCVVTLHPGWVKTDMGGADADLEVPESVAGVIAVLDRVTLADSGKFLNYDGRELPW